MPIGGQDELGLEPAAEDDEVLVRRDRIGRKERLQDRRPRAVGAAGRVDDASAVKGGQVVGDLGSRFVTVGSAEALEVARQCPLILLRADGLDDIGGQE